MRFLFLPQFIAGQQPPIGAVGPCQAPPGTFLRARSLLFCPLLCCPRGFNHVQQCLIGYLSKLFKRVLSLPGLFGPQSTVKGAVGSTEWWEVFSLPRPGGVVGSGLQDPPEWEVSCALLDDVPSSLAVLGAQGINFPAWQKPFSFFICYR